MLTRQHDIGGREGDGDECFDQTRIEYFLQAFLGSVPEYIWENGRSGGTEVSRRCGG